jgi:hypothetical protein
MGHGYNFRRETAKLAVKRWLRQVANACIHGATGGSGTVTVRASKGGRRRHIVLNDNGMAPFERHVAGRPGSALIFIRPDGSAHGRSQQRRPLLAACERADRPAGQALLDLLKERRDVFFGYSSSSETTAAAIKRYLLSVGARVLDWLTDFFPGRTILDQIEQAAARSIGGILLFTKDDDLKNEGPTADVVAVPRDNVVFKAGYFIGLKGKHNVLIIREAGSKMPADLGGDIYASLSDKASIKPIERTLAAFLDAI